MSNMRKHIGSHILIENLKSVCGFCGMSGCSIEIVQGSGRGKTSSRIVASNCEYKVKFSLKAAEKSTKTGPCTNRPVICKLCSAIEWSYNMLNHMEIKHSDHPRNEWVISKEEGEHVKEI